MRNNGNDPEQPLLIKLMSGYIEITDRLGPGVVRAAQDCRAAGHSTLCRTREMVVAALGRLGWEPPFINTFADAAGGALSSVLTFQERVVEAGVALHRWAAQSAFDAVTGKPD